MTDREILERAAQLLRGFGWDGIANRILDGRNCLPEADPPQPYGLEVRIAVLIGPSGGVFAIGVNPIRSDDEHSAELRAYDSLAYQMRGDDPTHKATGVLVVPPVTIPVVKGRIKP